MLALSLLEEEMFRGKKLGEAATKGLFKSRIYDVLLPPKKVNQRLRTWDKMTVLRKEKLNIGCKLGRHSSPSLGLDSQNAGGWGDTQHLPTDRHGKCHERWERCLCKMLELG